MVAATGTGAAQSDQPTITVTDGTTTTGSTTTVDVVITNAPDGLAGYYLDLAIENGETAQVESASYPEQFGLTSDPEITSGGTVVTLEAADTDGVVQSGATGITLATVTLSGTGPGEATLSIEPQQLDGDNGSLLDPTAQPGTVVVSEDDSETASVSQPSSETPVPGGGAEMPQSENDRGSNVDTEVQTTSASGPLPIVLSLVAIAILTAVSLRYRE